MQGVDLCLIVYKRILKRKDHDLWIALKKGAEVWKVY